MYKLCKSEQSASRQHALECGLLAAMGSHHYDEISVSDLCDQLGVPRKSFYRYFSGKEGALHALLDHTLMEFECYPLRSSAQHKRSAFTEMELFFRFWLEKKELLDALQRSDLSSLLIARAIHCSTTTVSIPVRFMAPEDQDITEQMTTFTITGLMSLVLDWHHRGYPQSPVQMADLAVRLVTKPLFPYTNRM